MLVGSAVICKIKDLSHLFVFLIIVLLPAPQHNIGNSLRVYIIRLLEHMTVTVGSRADTGMS